MLLFKHSCQEIEIDYLYDELAAALISSLSSSDKKLPQLLGGHADDIRSFLDSLAKHDDLKDCGI